MQIELFTLCDGAYNYNGKMTIVGTLNGIAVPQLPAQIKLSLAMRMRVGREDKGEKNMIVHFVNPEGKNIPVELAVKLNIVPTEEPESYITFAADIQGLPLEKEGRYCVDVTIDGEQVGNYPFNVQIKKQ